MATEWYVCYRNKEYIDCLGPFNNALIADNNYKNDMKNSTLLSVWRYIPNFIKKEYLKHSYNNIFFPCKIYITNPL